jgi:hypothetical protein
LVVKITIDIISLASFFKNLLYLLKFSLFFD